MTSRPEINYWRLNYGSTQKATGKVRQPAETIAELSRRVSASEDALRRRFAKTGGAVREAFRARGRIYYVKPDLDLWAENEGFTGG